MNYTGKMFQVSTLQALSTGYTKAVTSVEELMKHGDTGLGTFEDVNGEMIALDGHCYRAAEDGTVTEAPADEGVPFASVAPFKCEKSFTLDSITDIESLKDQLDLAIEEWFGLNSIHIVRIEGEFERISARSELSFRSQHISLKRILDVTQRSFEFDNVKGTMVCTRGGHTFDVVLKHGTVSMQKLTGVEIELPTEPAFDTYSLTEASQSEIKQVEQGKK